MYISFPVHSVPYSHFGYNSSANGLVDEERFTNVFNFGDCTFEVEGFGQDDFEDLDKI
jgi:hypothetical protein